MYRLDFQVNFGCLLTVLKMSLHRLIAQAFYKKIPESIVARVRERLTPDLRDVADRFNETFGCEYSSQVDCRPKPAMHGLAVPIAIQA